MKRSKALRIGGFVTAVCATTALVAAATQSTGAYFTSTAKARISASSGHLTLNIWHSNANGGAGKWIPADTGGLLSMQFNNLNPGEPQDQSVSYQVDSTDSVDIWLVFDTTDMKQTLADDPVNTAKTKTGSGYQLFTGGGSDDNTGLGRYGYFKAADSNGGTAFVSGNLKFADSTNDPQSAGSCSTSTTTGRGGSSWIATESDQHPTLYCGVPQAIELASGLGNGATGTVTLTLGLDGFLQTWQNQPEPTVPFEIVATQHGQAPVDLGSVVL